jgi:5-methyltetrahydrofolate--homocysteine methyltransferase
LPDLLEKLLPILSPLNIVNQILLPAMQEVGKRFAAGQMQLPFVLLSAETMKLAVKILEPKMERSDDAAKGKLLIATVKGDVHDIGKNLVDIIVSNNGFEVIDLGIKQPIEDILVAIDQHNPDAVGFSGLLVKSTLIMKENLKVMFEKGIRIPVICGGAALTKEYVETDLKAAYGDGPVYYGADAFSGLKLMEELEQTKDLKGVRRKISSDSSNSRREDVEDSKSDLAVVSPSPAVPTPPFWGVRYVNSSQLQLEKIIPFINKKALYYRQWRFNTGHSSAAAQRAFIDDKVEPIFQLWCQKILNDRWLEPQVGYGYFPCQSEGNELHVFDAEDKRQRLYTIVFPRQPKQGLCLADYFRNVTSGEYDLLALQIVTVGDCASRKSQELYAANEYSDYLYFHGLAVEFAEALAEYWHKQIRHELGIDNAEASEPSALFAKRYQGARYSFGYAACPNIEDQKLFFKLFDPAILGISLTSEYQLVPEQSTSAIIVHHPEAKYFAANGDATS